MSPRLGRAGTWAGAAIATALSLLLAVTAPAAPPTLTVDATDAAIGQTIGASAELSESPAASGEIAFEVFGPDDPTCLGPALETSQAPVSGEGQYASADFTPTVAGLYRWSAHYSGDEANPAAEAPCAAISTVAKASPELTGSAGSGVVGGAIADSVSLTGGFSPSGEVTFSVFAPADTGCSTPLATTSAALESGEAISGDFVPQQAGEFRWTASYSGDANNEGFDLECNAGGQSSTVTKATPGLTGSAGSGVVGTPVRDEVTLAGGFSPGGEVTFSVHGPADTACTTPLETMTVAVAGGTATSGDFVPPQAGEFRWTASYAGDANNEAVSLGCNAGGQVSTVTKASPGLAATATSVVVVGQAITDQAALSGGFSPGGEIVFRAYGPEDPSCSGTPAYEEAVPVSGNGPYSPAGFAPGPGVYRWTVEYEGDGNNGTVELACGVGNQASAVGTIDVTLAAGAGDGTVGQPIEATATIQRGATPGGQITFKAFPPGDTNCSGAAAFSSTVGVSGNGSYRSEAFAPSRVGTFRWTAAYSGDPNHAPATSGCGQAASNVARAKPTIAGAVPQRLTVGTSFRDTATLQGAYAPGGTVSFRIYGPNADGCAKPAFVNTVAVSGNGTVSSDPFAAQIPGRYSFVASYSGDASNQGATEPCGSAGQVVQIRKRTPQVKPRARLVGGRQIAIRARFSGGASPSGAVTFRLYRPGDKRCRRKPAFSGGVTIQSNGTVPLARYIATKVGVYRLSVGYSGDQRNQRHRIDCDNAQPIRVRQSS